MAVVKLKKPLEYLDRPGNHINEKDYLVEYGATRHSTNFWKMVKSRVGQITHAKMVYKDNSHYRFYLRTTNDAVIEFQGFAGGYGGTGPSECYDLLVDAGFDKEKARVVFKQSSFFLAKDEEQK